MAHNIHEMDSTKNKFHKVLTEWNWVPATAGVKANRLVPNRRDADYLEIIYIHPVKAKDRVIVHVEQNGEQTWFLKFQQDNGIIAPSYGTTKPGLVRTLEFNYGKKA